MKIASIVGARPQFVKLAPVHRQLAEHCGHVIVHTGQHYDYRLSRALFDDLALPEPRYDLGVGSGSHAHQTGEMLVRVEEVLLKEEPDLVLLYGDTNSTLAGGLAAVKLEIPVAHVEAGLRSYVLAMPEEVNRRLTDHLSTLLFAPTQRAVENLRREGLTTGVLLTGDVMVDALDLVRAPVREREGRVLSAVGVMPQEYVLVTIHRPRNTDDPEILRGLLRCLARIDDVVLFPAHPRTRKALERLGPEIGREGERLLVDGRKTTIRLLAPATYLEMIALERNARRILTDSGGVQKEAYLLRVPCITLRRETEWVETVAAGWNTLVDTDQAAVLDALQAGPPPAAHPPIFGDGRAAERIVTAVIDFLKSTT